MARVNQIVVAMSADNMSASEFNTDSPEPRKPRFYEAREGEVELIREGRHELNTKRATTFAVNVFKHHMYFG